MPHLLIVGPDLDRLVALSLALSDSFQSTTIAVADDVLERGLWSALREPCHMVLCFDAAAGLTERQREKVQTLTSASPAVIFLVPDACSRLRGQLTGEGAIVLGADEPPTILAATLAAYESGPHRILG